MEGVIKETKINRYLAYKNSGIEWLGEIPQHWKILRGNYVFTIINERSDKGDEELLSVSEHYGVKPRSDSNVSMFMAESYKGYKLCYPGDLVINSLWAWSRGLGISKYSGIVSTAYSVYRPNHNNYDKDYLNYLLRMENYVVQYLIASKGIWISRLLLSDWSFLRLPILSPPKKEQILIVQFLDRITTQIDEAISQKERLIELLKEHKQLLIHNAVTRGLDSTVPMKESGVEWVGTIPAHWKVKRLKTFTKVQSGLTLGKVYQEGNLVQISYLRVANVQDGFLKLDDIADISIPPGIVPDFLLRKNDILVTEGGDIDKLGRGAIWNEEIKPCVHQNHVFAVRVESEEMIPQFVSLLFSCDYGKKYFTTTANKTTNLASTNKTKLGNFPALIVPLEEQKEILNYVALISRKIDLATNKTTKQIEKLKEYKSTLINSAVTGKIKVS